MKLDRDINESKAGKYALLKLRKLDRFYKIDFAIRQAVTLLVDAGCIDWGPKGDENEFFVIKLKDINAEEALLAYANKASSYDKEWSDSVKELAKRSGQNSPFCKVPD